MSNYINLLRKYELDCILEIYGFNIFENKKILEIGSGNGFILKEFKKMGLDASGIDIAFGSMFTEKNPDVIYYNGKNIPFNDNSFDLIYSSNCLEHISHLDEFQSELNRVLKPGSVSLHVMPNHVWRFWTVVVHYFVLPRRINKLLKETDIGLLTDQKSSLNLILKNRFFHLFKSLLFYPKHGERGNRFNEFFYFHPIWWKKYFIKNGWINFQANSLPIFYTDHTLFSMLSIKQRAMMSKIFGSVVTCYKIESKL